MSPLRRLLPFAHPYRADAARSLAALVTVAAMDLSLPRLVERIIDQGIRAGDQAVIVQTALAMLALSAASTVLAVGNNTWSVRVGEGVARDLRSALFRHVTSLSVGNLERERTGELLVRLTSDVAAVKTLVQVTLRIGTRAPLMILGSITLMALTDAHLALTMLPVLAVTSILVAAFVVGAEPLFRRIQERLDVVNTVLQENVAGARVVRAFVQAARERARFDAANGELADAGVRAMRTLSFMSPALALCLQVGLVAVVWQGGGEAIRGELTLGQLVAFSNYLLTTMAPLVLMTTLSSTWASGLASARRVDRLLTTPPDLVDARTGPPLPPTLDVHVDAARFAYAPGSEPAVDGVTLRARPGETIGILGATGSGKSTLLQLVPRLYDPQSGAVEVGGRDVRTIPAATLVGRVGLVPQESLLVSGTIRDNIRYGRPDASDDDVQAAAHAADAHGFISALPEGYESHVAPRGANLSGGQRQRLALARALLVHPAILLLDDCTSAVDAATERRIRAALTVGAADRVTVVVAQRVSSVLGADRIVVLERGRVVAEGSHDELMASSPVYREIYDSQLGAAP